MARKKLTDAPEDLSAAEKAALNKWLRKKINEGDLPRAYWSGTKARRMVEHCLIYHRARGIQRASWVATVQEWFRKQAEMDAWIPPRSRRRPRKRPRQGQLDLDSLEVAEALLGPPGGEKSGEMEPISSVIGRSRPRRRR